VRHPVFITQRCSKQGKKGLGGKNSVGGTGKEIGRGVEKKKVSSDMRARDVSDTQRDKRQRARTGPQALAGLGPSGETGESGRRATRAGASGPRAMVGCG
jgi:hypothetical protein